jgi:hypothetical protein
MYTIPIIRHLFFRPQHRLGVASFLSLLALLVSACQTTEPPPPVSTPDTLCFPQAIGVPGQPQAPSINGIVSNDYGWTMATRYLFNNGTSAPDVAVQGLRDASFLYLSFEVNLDPTFDNNDAIVLAFSPGGGAANDRRIHIFPVFAGVGAQESGVPRAVYYWNNSNTWNTPASTTRISNPTWLVDNIRVTSTNAGLNNNSWTVEMRIPITDVAANADPALDTGINFPASGTFKMYLFIARIDSTVNPPQVNPFVWPPSAPQLLFNIETSTPVPTNNWGDGSRGGVNCSGVTINAGSIYVNTQGSHSIKLNDPNTFYARIYNHSVDAAGNFIQAEGVRATFRIANFGLGSAWSLIPATAGTNPTAAVNIPAATEVATGEATMNIGWTLNAAQQGEYAQPGTNHQCILVELESEVVGTTFVNRSAWTNMKFTNATSPFFVQAFIGTTGFKLREGMNDYNIQLREYAYNYDPRLSWDSSLDAKSIGENLYLLTLKPETGQLLTGTVFIPDIFIPNETINIPPGAGVTEMPMVQVQPGGLVTVIASGSLFLRGENKEALVGPGGTSMREFVQDDSFLLDTRYNPQLIVGSLIGSWDEFGGTWFPIGGGVSLRVPEDAYVLYLAINDVPDGYTQHTGEGFTAEVVATGFEEYFGVVDTVMTRDPQAPDFYLPLGANLPTYITCGTQTTGETLEIEGETYTIVESMGCYGYIVKHIGH